MMKYVRGIEIVIVSATVVFVSGCGTNQANFAPAAGPNQRMASPSYSVIHSFSGSDGAHPLVRLIVIGNTLYGTTSDGGSHVDGVAFKIDTGGAERVLHSFGAATKDGQFPAAALFEQGGVLYGTTNIGGAAGTGTVYSLTTDGSERVLKSFGQFGPDPAQPYASLIAAQGRLYGTTTAGGRGGTGSVYSIDTKGKVVVVHSFGPLTSHDGQVPVASLIVVNGTVYGTTAEGGLYRRSGCQPAPCPGYGVAYSVDASGKETVLHNFGNSGDGVNPSSDLIYLKGRFYGTTKFGGRFGYGTVFSMTTSGVETVLHNFGGSGDGGVPMSRLSYVNGQLYGTTAGGGAYKTHGTVFSIALDGSNETIVHSFGASGDGSDPEAGLTYLGGKFYGMTKTGGAANDGTVFSLTP